jgi:hypothetical protein
MGVPLLAALLVAASTALAPASVLAAPTPADVARADAAFEEGRALYVSGRFKEAMRKFELSQRVDPSPGTLLNLASCHEAEGDLLQALSWFKRALLDAERADDPRRKQLWSDAARERISSLTRSVPVLVLSGIDSASRVSLDGQALDAPVDVLRLNPGRHTVVVSAPGKPAFMQQVELVVGQQVTLDVRASEPPVEPAHALDAGVEQKRYGAWPFVLGGAGAVLIGTGIATGLSAKAKQDTLERECSGVECPTSLQGTRDAAHTLATISDVAWVTGVLSLGAGVTLFVLDAGRGSSDVAMAAGCFDAVCGLQASGRF